MTEINAWDNISKSKPLLSFCCITFVSFVAFVVIISINYNENKEWNQVLVFVPCMICIFSMILCCIQSYRVGRRIREDLETTNVGRENTVPSMSFMPDTTMNIHPTRHSSLVSFHVQQSSRAHDPYERPPLY